MTGNTMKSGVVEPDRGKLDFRQHHRRKMAKTLHVLNGGDLEEVNMVRQVNLAAAYHDHISCTKSPDLCNKTSDTKESRANLPCETDHIYANCSENKSSKIHNMVAVAPSRDDRRQLQDMCLLHLELIKILQEQNAAKEKQIQILRQENEVLKIRQERIERRVYLQKKPLRSDTESDNFSDVGSVTSDSPVPSMPRTQVNEISSPTKPTIHLATRYFGRRSKTIPSRALKRRYLGPPKSFPCKKPAITHSSSAASMSSASENQDEEKIPNYKTLDTTTEHSEPIDSSEEGLVKALKKRVKKQKVIAGQEDFLTTDKEYYLPKDHSVSDALYRTQTIDVPSWRFRPFPSFYQMEGTENIDDKIFQRRHLKCEQDEKRRKRWDMQRFREQKITQKLKQKNGGPSIEADQADEEGSFKRNSTYVQYIEVTEDRLPVMAFGCPIPSFKPCEFALPDVVLQSADEEDNKNSHTYTNGGNVSFGKQTQ